MQDTLNLWSGDLADVEIICEVERRFGIEVTDAEAKQLYTAGHFHDLIEAKYAGAHSTQACLSQAAFYRLRRALKAMGFTGEISPRTPLSIIEGLEPRSVAKNWRRLGQTAELNLPKLETSFRRWLFRTIPSRLVTVGDLAREAAGHSFAKLVAVKKGSARSDRWFALAAILRLVSGHQRAITRDTTFFAAD